MQHTFFAAALAATLALAAVPGAARAQDRIYRCPGNEYTNSAASARQHGCKVVEGGNVTIVPAPRMAAPAASEGRVSTPRAATPRSAPAGGGGSVVTAPPPAPRIDSGEQRARDSDARAILEGELRRAQARQLDLERQYNGGNPERTPSDADPQRYRDRTAELKAAVARNEADIAGIKRELARLPGAR